VRRKTSDATDALHTTTATHHQINISSCAHFHKDKQTLHHPPTFGRFLFFIDRNG
jgi:hypothetical protein